MTAVIPVKYQPVNVAVTLLLWLMVTVQVPTPLHSPDHPLNEYPKDGEALMVMVLPVA